MIRYNLKIRYNKNIIKILHIKAKVPRCLIDKHVRILFARCSQDYALQLTEKKILQDFL